MHFKILNLRARMATTHSPVALAGRTGHQQTALDGLEAVLELQPEKELITSDEITSVREHFASLVLSGKTLFRIMPIDQFEANEILIKVPSTNSSLATDLKDEIHELRIQLKLKQTKIVDLEKELKEKNTAIKANEKEIESLKKQLSLGNTADTMFEKLAVLAEEEIETKPVKKYSSYKKKKK